MTNHPITSSAGGATHLTDLDREVPRPRIRRVALIRTDASGFKLVAEPSKLALRGQ